jgi:hypothetical protein
MPPPKKAVSIRGVRSGLYGASKILGDLSALSKGQVGKRVVRRVAGKATGRGLRIFN